MGSLVPDPDGGDRIDGFQVHLGGQLGGAVHLRDQAEGPARRRPDLPHKFVASDSSARGSSTATRAQDFSEWFNGLEPAEAETVVAGARG